MQPNQAQAKQATPPTQLMSIESVRQDFKKMESQIKAVLPPHVTVEKFTRVVLTAIQQNQDLLRGTRQSLFGACMKAAQDGLLPDGREAAMVLFKDRKQGITQVQYMPMVAGILKKVRNSGEITTINSQIVRKDDEFDIWTDDTGQHIKHRAKLVGNLSEPIGAFAVAKTKDGEVFIEWMNRDEIYQVRNFSKAENGPWAGPFEGEMWRKTVIRRLAKRLPMSTDVESVVRRDDELSQDLIPANMPQSTPEAHHAAGPETETHFDPGPPIESYPT